ncbi:MAG: histidine kinase [Bacillota bacterium]|nr:histidine kinase [Bacillota bacterium]
MRNTFRLIHKLSSPGIRFKLIVIVFGATILITLSAIFYMHTFLITTLADQLDKRVVSIARDVAARSMEPILTNNLYMLYQLAYQTMDSNEDLIYIFYMDNNGSIMAHTFQDYFPPDLLTIEHESEDGINSIKKFQTEEGVLRDAAAYVFPGPEPDITVRVGLVDYSLQEALAISIRRLLLVSAITFVLVSSGIYFITTFTTIKPLNNLLKLVQAVTKGNYSQQVTTKSRDELSILAKAFNDMTWQLEQSKQTRDRLMKKIIHSQEDERRRISRELHDETGQMFCTLMISLQFLENADNLNELKEKTAEFRQLLQHSVEQVRQLAWKLTPAPLIDLGLKSAVELMIKYYRNSSDWDIILQIEGMENRRLLSDIETSVYRAIQESLTNISRHACADNISVFMKYYENKLMVQIKDNGVGFDLKKQAEERGSKSSMGLISMQERISLVGGKLEIESAPGKGTTIYIIIPLVSLGNDTLGHG